MPSRKTRYTRLETDQESNSESDDEAPPTHVQLHSSHNIKGIVIQLLKQAKLVCFFVLIASRWNHIENLDEFFDRVSLSPSLLTYMSYMIYVLYDICPI